MVGGSLAINSQISPAVGYAEIVYNAGDGRLCMNAFISWQSKTVISKVDRIFSWLWDSVLPVMQTVWRNGNHSRRMPEKKTVVANKEWVSEESHGPNPLCLRNSIIL